MATDKTPVMVRIAPSGLAWIDSLTTRSVRRANIVVEAVKFAHEHQAEFEKRIKALEGF